MSVDIVRDGLFFVVVGGNFAQCLLRYITGRNRGCGGRFMCVLHRECVCGVMIMYSEVVVVCVFFVRILRHGGTLAPLE
jgi:hypothetical protein